MTGFKGVRNVNGRPKGTLNKATAELREKFTLLVENNFDKLQSDIDLLEPKDRIKTILELAKFVIPVLRSTELIGETDNNNFQPIILNLGAGINPNM
ncbi:hypothetical protein EKM01_12145 [Flavobacterium sp. RSP46]|uniref:hypothetical protein n=1 Tax=Flavobacterium sp. RSP46 TaxID=2497486 RepID=UPI000F86C2CC|nr:hypothetical protein [Flavobacterium sp. RSP46]RTY89861.1 hypothetical protein EKM01_12145 [Flavobacterium sp. RSP46]